ncbi:MAG: GntR family transcriptional regulator [Planctomycetales bacterium]|nr:GntR family transcriptional regulator [Planctomycetales bacterium]MCA9167492.1 GntR family transcriptional regulator [Planctomycetales bacterium]
MKARPVDSRNPLPLHAQVEQRLRELIAQPSYQDGLLLPDELTLAAQFGVSRGTVRAAILRLVAQGLLTRRSGVGTQVRQQAAESAISAWRSLTQEMSAKGILVQTFRAECRQCPASAAAAAALMVEVGTPLWRLDRLRGWDETPVLNSRSWFHPRLNLRGTEDFQRPLYEVLEEASGVVADSAHEEFLAVAADARMAKRLGVTAGSPLLLRRHVVRDRGSRSFEFAEVHYVSTRYTLSIELHRGE